MSKSSRSSSRSSPRSTNNTRSSSREASKTAHASPPPHESIDDFDDTFKPDMYARGRATRRKADPKTTASGAPWVKNGVDYGPARAAIQDLAAWALDLAEREVDEDPSDLKRIRNVRRALLGRSSREPSTRDLMFVAELLARVFDRDLGLGLADQLAIFEQLDLSTAFLPLEMPTPRAPTPLHGRIPTRIPAPTSAEPPTATVRIRLEPVPIVRIDARTPPPLRYCDDCGRIHELGDHVHLYRNAA